MDSRVKMCVSLALLLLLVAREVPARPQDKPHVVSLADLNKDTAQAAQRRQANEKAVRALLASEQGQKALKSAHLDYQRVGKAIIQLSDEDLAKLAQRSRQVQADFAAGRISNTLIVVTVIVAVAVIVLAATLPKD